MCFKKWFLWEYFLGNSRLFVRHANITTVMGVILYCPITQTSEVYLELPKMNYNEVICETWRGWKKIKKDLKNYNEVKFKDENNLEI